jgi:hypothetical protein
LTGYEEKELTNKSEFNVIAKYVDLIIAGRYEEQHKIQKGIRGSSNKKYLFFSNEYMLDELVTIPALEIIATNDGILTLTGIMPDLIKNYYEE